MKTLQGEWSENANAIARKQVKGMNGYGSWLKLQSLYAKRKDLAVWVCKFIKDH